MVKEGYKETEIGIIPEEWKVSYLNDFGDIISGGTPRTNVREYWDGGIAWCTPSDITQTCGKYISETNKTITELGLKNSSANLLPEGTILLCTRATIGELKISRIPMATNQGFKNILLNTPNNVDYLYYLLQTKKNDMIELAIGTTFLEISKGALCKIQLQTPPIIEQKNIAEALSDIDNLISSLEKVIEKKKAIKQACLQKMFPKYGETTPEMRLPGFTEPWEQRKLGEVVRLNGRIGFRGYTEKDIVSKDEGGVLTFSPTNIVNNTLTTNCKNTYITRFKYDESPEIKIHNGDILFVKTGSTLGKSALVTGLFEDATLNPQVVVMRSNKHNTEFLAALLITNSIFSQVNADKIGGAVPTLTETKIKDFNVAIPVSESEKTQIGQFFTNLDNLITLHQRKLEKYKKIKQGMMQQLLTGKIRLL
ncbi:MAG: hypothetical protein HFI90_06585 [Clostridia bacterium]|nr:hypothetical protein [Clostridia bacterium]